MGSCVSSSEHCSGISTTSSTTTTSSLPLVQASLQAQTEGSTLANPLTGLAPFPSTCYTPTDGGFPIELFTEPVESYLICSICNDVVCNPLNLEACSHLFCSTCLRKYRNQECPNCRVSLPENKVLATIPFVAQLLAQRQVRCPFMQNGCSWVGMMGTDARNVQLHIDQCIHNPVFRCEQCDTFVAVSHRDEHTHHSCANRLLPCSFCRQMIRGYEYPTHISRGEIHGQPCANASYCSFGCYASDVSDSILFVFPTKESALRHETEDCLRNLVACQLCATPHTVPQCTLLVHYMSVTKHMSIEQMCKQLTVSLKHIRPRPTSMSGIAEHGSVPHATLQETMSQKVVAPQLLGTLHERLCTFTTTGKTFIQQPWFLCHTCVSSAENIGCCLACAEQCHRGHKLEPMFTKGFYCDCGAGLLPNSFKCRCIVKKVNSTHLTVAGLGRSSSSSINH